MANHEAEPDRIDYLPLIVSGAAFDTLLLQRFVRNLWQGAVQPASHQATADDRPLELPTFYDDIGPQPHSLTEH